jgi:hypothetical protein
MTFNDEIDAKVDTLFAAHLADRPEALKIFFDHVRENYRATTARLSKHVIAVGVVWIAAILIDAGSVEEVEVLSLKVRKIGSLLAFFVPVLGAMSHQIFTGTVQSIALWGALRRSYKYTLPKAHQIEIVHLAAPTSFMDDARILAAGSGVFRTAWVALIVLGILFAFPLFSMLHVAQMVYTRPSGPGSLELWALAVGFGLWLHGLVMYFAVAASRARKLRQIDSVA